MSVIVRAIFIGIGATVFLDVWGFLLGLFKIKSLDNRYIGRWIAHFPKGKFVHDNITMTTPVRGEVALGWAAHYLVGIAFAFLLVVLYGKAWLEQPTLFPALVIGIVTLCAPLFVMQPALGFGIASSKLSKPNMRRLKSLSTHLAYGIGLYLTAVLMGLSAR